MRIALGIEYKGVGYYGWQAQENLPTIQSSLEKALSIIADEPIKTICAGRTDAGVHALDQVIHFDTNAKRSIDAWLMGTNTHLPPSIVVRWVKHVTDDFHARFSALSRKYCYVIFNSLSRPAILSQQVTWFYEPLNVEMMQVAGQYLLGEQDFSSFRSSQCESLSPMRNIHEITITKQQNYIFIKIEANAFLHHMVRNIVGVLLKIGTERKEPQWMQEVLLAKDRRAAATTAAPHGLYLTKVVYASRYSIPIRETSSHLIAL